MFIYYTFFLVAGETNMTKNTLEEKLNYPLSKFF